MTDAAAPVLRIHNRWQQSLLVACGLVFLLLGVGEIVTGSWAGALFGMAVTVFAAGLIYRSARMGVLVDAHGVVSRTVDRTQRIAWCELASGGRGDAGSAVPGLSTALFLAGKSGRSVVLGDAAGHPTQRTSARLQQMQADLEAVFAAHRASCPGCAAHTDGRP